jgi:dihydroflavonol-4-reductase
VKILVTGGTGFLGAHLVPRLLAESHEVTVLARSSPGPALAGARHVAADLQDREGVRRALEGAQALYHLAGLVSFDPKDGRRMFELHVDATRLLLGDAREAGVGRVILASTSGTTAVCREPKVATEADDYPIEVVGRWPYYASKMFEEKLALEYCRRHQLPLVVLNPSLLLGPGDARLSSTWIVSKFLAQQIPTLPGGGLSFVDVRDAAQVFLAALTRGELYGRHLFGVNMALAEFFARLSRLTGVRAPKVRLPSSLAVLGGHLLERWAKARGQEPSLVAHEVEIGEHFFYLDPSKAERELGFVARDPHQTLFDTVHDLLGRMPPGSIPGWKGTLQARRSGT